MKKLIIFLFVFVAIASFGGILRPAHAHADNSLTPAEAATLQQSLDAMKAKLLELQTEANAQVNVPALPPTLNVATLSAEDKASLRNALALLASALTNLETSLAQNPQLATGREQAVLTALKGIGATLSSIGTTLGGQAIAATPVPTSIASPVAQSAPAPSEGTMTPLADTSPAARESALTSPANASPATAQVGSSWSLKNLNWPLVIVIVLVIAAVALWLFWPGEEEKEKKQKPTVVMNTTRPMAPLQAPMPTVAMPSHVEKPMSPQQSSQPQQQQRKPA